MPKQTKRDHAYNGRYVISVHLSPRDIYELVCSKGVPLPPWEDWDKSMWLETTAEDHHEEDKLTIFDVTLCAVVEGPK